MTPIDTELGYLLEALRDGLEGSSADELDAALERLMQDELEGEFDAISVREQGHFLAANSH
jgi:hypothetical protein